MKLLTKATLGFVFSTMVSGTALAHDQHDNELQERQERMELNDWRLVERGLATPGWREKMSESSPEGTSLKELKEWECGIASFLHPDCPEVLQQKQTETKELSHKEQIKALETEHAIKLKALEERHAIELKAAQQAAHDEIEAAKNCESEGTCDALLKEYSKHFGIDINFKNPVQAPISRPAQP